MRESMARRIWMAIALAFFSWPALALAQSEAVSVVAVAGTGCLNDQFHVTVARANLDGNPYTLHFVASIGGLVYTNQAATFSVDGSSDFYIYSSFSAGSVPNEGTYPMPTGQPIQIDVALERPFGKVLTSWRTVVDGCDTGVIQSNGPPPVPTPQNEALSVLGINLLGCIDDVFNITVQATGLDNGPYTLRAVATVGGLVYTNSHFSLVADDTRFVYVYSSFSYGTVPNPGTFPMPAGQPLQFDLTLERPAGTLLYHRRFVVDGCDTGNVTLNAVVPLVVLTAAPVPALHPAGLALLAGLLGALFAWRRRERR